MHCKNCDTRYCLWCRTIIVAKNTAKQSKSTNLDNLTHNHVFECQKAPPKTEILTESVLMPIGEDDDPTFVHFLLLVRKLKTLQMQMVQGAIFACECTLYTHCDTCYN